MSRWVRIALKTACLGEHPRHLVGAIVVKGGKVLSKAANLSRPYGVLNGGFHAEERALREEIDYRGAVVIVVRVNKKTKIVGMSRPCERCMRVIISKGIKKIIYMDSELTVCVEKV